MPSTEREELPKQSKEGLQAFIRQHPEYSIDNFQPVYRGGTNLVTFGQRRTETGEQQPVVYKYFIRTYRYSQEYFCLRHFADTGHVPIILDAIPDRLIVMTRLPDSHIEGETAHFNLDQRKQVSRQIGHAIGDLVQWPLPTAESQPIPETEFEQFAWRTDVGAIIKDVLVCCRQIQANVPAYQTSLYTESLYFAEKHVDYIAQQPRCLFHEDIPNLCIYEGHFQGFYDLEMARIGTEALQLGVALDLCRPHWMEGEWLVWAEFIEGYQERTGRTLTESDFLAILTMSHFYYHIRICRWCEWDGDLTQSDHLEFATRFAERYHTYMKRTCMSIKGWVDLYKWFPSLR
ncbi:MAG: phosphotransferase [Chloroflexota bacterium]